MGAPGIESDKVWAAKHRPPLMVSLVSTTAAHGPVLVLDAATTRMQAGLWRPGQPPVWKGGGDDASVHLFEAADACLRDGGLRPSAIGAFVFCDGPGSQLGIRTACMAIRTWRTMMASPAPVFGYRSLVLAAHALRKTRATPFALISDARRDSWHAVRVDARGAVSAVLRASTAEVAAWPEELLQPEGFRAWSKPPRPTSACAYDCAAMWTDLQGEALLIEADPPAPWQSAAIAYQTWTGERHRAPVAQQSAAQQ